MQVILSTNQAPLQPNQGVKSTVPAKQQEQRLLVEQDKKEQKKPQQESRFDVSEEAIAAVEQALENNAQLSSFLPQQGKNKSANGNIQKEYDKPSEQNLSAVAKYQSVGNISQRESIKDVFGVDLFA